MNGKAKTYHGVVTNWGSQTSIKIFLLLSLRRFHPNRAKIGRVRGPRFGSAPACGSDELI